MQTLLKSFFVLVALTLGTKAQAIKYEFSENGKDMSVTYDRADYRTKKFGPANLPYFPGHPKGKLGQVEFDNNIQKGFYRLDDDFGPWGVQGSAPCDLMIGPPQAFSGNGTIYITFEWFAWYETFQPRPATQKVLDFRIIRNSQGVIADKQLRYADIDKQAQSVTWRWDQNGVQQTGFTIGSEGIKRYYGTGTATVEYTTNNSSEFNVWGSVCANNQVSVGVRSVKVRFAYNQ